MVQAASFWPASTDFYNYFYAVSFTSCPPTSPCHFSVVPSPSGRIPSLQWSATLGQTYKRRTPCPSFGTHASCAIRRSGVHDSAAPPEGKSIWAVLSGGNLKALRTVLITLTSNPCTVQNAPKGAEPRTGAARHIKQNYKMGRSIQRNAKLVR